MIDAAEYLTRALDKYERNRKSNRIFVDIEPAKNHAEVVRLEKEFSELEALGVIENRRKNGRGGIIEKIKLLSPEGAYSQLGRVPAWEQSVKHLDGLKRDSEPGLRGMLEKIEASWSRNVAWVGPEVRLQPGSVDGLENAIKIARELSRLVKPTDYRTLSLMAGCSSKTLERTEELVAAVAAAITGYDRAGRTAREFLGELGAEKMPQAIFVAAPKSLPATYIGLPPEEIRAFRFHDADYVITIENWVSFVRYAREIQDGGIVFYTGGFPSKSWRDAFVDVLSRQKEAQVFHWGDVDEFGIHIASMILAIAKQAGRPAMPHLMSVEVVGRQSEGVPRARKAVEQMPSLAAPALESLWAWLMSPEGMTLEQESRSS